MCSSGNKSLFCYPTILTIVQSRRIELILLFLSGTSELNEKWSKKPVVEECAEDEERAL
jgi:hypothetical protein